MGLIGTVLSTERSTNSDGAKVTIVKFDAGGGDIQTGELFAPSGVDAPPLPGDSVEAVSGTRSGGHQVVGSIDPNNAGVADDGEHRTYGRDSSGAIVSEIWQKGDGSIEITATGNVSINGVTIDPLGNIAGALNIDALGKITATEIEALTSLLVQAIEVLGHVHISAAPGAPSGPMQAP